MNNWDWQLIVALICVAGALCALIRRAIRLFWGDSSGACGSGGCGSCPSKTEQNGLATQEKELVPLQTIQFPSHKEKTSR